MPRHVRRRARGHHGEDLGEEVFPVHGLDCLDLDLDLRVESGESVDGALAGGALAATGPVPALLGTRPLVAIGKISYGLYLWHWPIFAITRPGVDIPVTGLANAALRLGLTVVVGWVREVSLVQAGLVERRRPFPRPVQVARVEREQRLRVRARLCDQRCIRGILEGRTREARREDALDPHDPDQVRLRRHGAGHLPRGGRYRAADLAAVLA